jgi:signal transduction histidine kinase
MKALSWPPDTITRRFALAQVLALAVTLGLILIFDALAGVWSQEPLENTGLLNEAADIARIMEAAPPGERPSLAAAAATKRYDLSWYDPTSAVARVLDARPEADTEAHIRQHFISDAHRRAATFRGNSRTAVMMGGAFGHGRLEATYVLALQLSDQSWLIFTTPRRAWGLPPWARVATRVAFLALSILIVSAIAARAVSRPVEELAKAVLGFRVGADSPAIAEAGPSEIKKVIRVFNAMQAQIQRFVAYRTMMLAAISHDLRTPLTRVRLRGEYIEDPEQQQRLFRDVDDMQKMIDGALAFFRDDAAEEPMTVFDLPQVLLTIVNNYADQGVEVLYTGPTHVSYNGRPLALKRAFTNVIENAVKYGSPPSIELTRTDSALTIAIRDRGPGIPTEDLARVFRPYYRQDKSRNRTTGGVGLGLAVAQAIVHGHAGEIKLENRAGGGLEASITLPLGSDSAPSVGYTPAL